MAALVGVLAGALPAGLPGALFEAPSDALAVVGADEVDDPEAAEAADADAPLEPGPEDDEDEGEP